MSAIKLHLLNYNGRYYSGETIEGKVVCSFSTPTEQLAITVNITGKEHTAWRREKEPDRGQICRGDNKFYQDRVILQSQGHHEFNFTIELPDNLPSTYNGNYGWIKYHIEVVVPRTDHRYKTEFTVTSKIDLNKMPIDLQSSRIKSEDKKIWCWWCAGGPITLCMLLEKAAYAPGDIIKAKLECTNLSHIDVEYIHVKVKKRIKSKAEDESRYTDELLVRTTKAGVSAHSDKWYEIRLQLPAITDVPNFSLCKLFEHKCIIEASAEFSGLYYSDLKVTEYITLGHIAYADPVASAPPENLSSSGSLPYPSSNFQNAPYPPDIVSHIGFIASTTDNNDNAPFLPPLPPVPLLQSLDLTYPRALYLSSNTFDPPTNSTNDEIAPAPPYVGRTIPESPPPSYSDVVKVFHPHQ